MAPNRLASPSGMANEPAGRRLTDALAQVTSNSDAPRLSPLLLTLPPRSACPPPLVAAHPLAAHLPDRYNGDRSLGCARRVWRRPA